MSRYRLAAHVLMHGLAASAAATARSPHVVYIESRPDLPVATFRVVHNDRVPKSKGERRRNRKDRWS